MIEILFDFYHKYKNLSNLWFSVCLFLGFLYLDLFYTTTKYHITYFKSWINMSILNSYVIYF
jgi:hypothetical protein